MTNAPNPENAPRSFIELEPLGAEIVPPSENRPSGGWAPDLSGDSGQPVPNRPGYRCPNCRYDVRNIAGRTCPECGDTFSIGEARVAGIADDPRSADDRKVILREKVFNYGAIAVFVVCFFTPFIHSGRFPTAGGVFLQLVLLAPFVTFGVGVSHYFSRSVSESAIITVALYAGFTALCVMLF